MSSKLTMEVELGMQGMPREHPASAQAIEEFLDDIYDEAGIVVTQGAAISADTSKKGGFQEYFLVPGSASAAWAVVRIVKLWLARDRRRTINITISQPGHEPLNIQGSGENLSLGALEKTVNHALANSYSHESDR